MGCGSSKDGANAQGLPPMKRAQSTADSTKQRARSQRWIRGLDEDVDGADVGILLDEEDDDDAEDVVDKEMAKMDPLQARCSCRHPSHTLLA